MLQEKPNKILILLHSETSPAGSLITWCEENLIPFNLIDVRSSTFEQLNQFEFNWLVILGGPQNVDQESKYPWLAFEKKFIKNAIESGKKVLGLCLGGQLIAEVLGAKVGPHPHWEVGFQIVKFENTHPVLSFSEARLPMFHWHGYSFNLPNNAFQIASNECTPCQGFLYKERVIAVQFHPETTVSWARYCATDDSDPYPEGPYVQSPTDILKNLESQKVIQKWFFNLLNQIKVL